MNKKDRSKQYSTHQEFDMILPYQFLLICRLLQVPPQQVLYQFMANLGQESYANGDEPKLNAMDYFLSCGYGQDRYTGDEVEQMFRELNNIGSLWPKDGKMKLIDLHNKWRNMYQGHWYKKWFRKRQQ
jgi:hypothetical protein